MIFILKIAIIVLVFVVIICLMKNKVNELLTIILRYLDKKQFNPTLDDIKNEDLKKLANRLKGDSDKKTLTNILEWEERNIRVWDDRIYMFAMFSILIVLSAVLLPIDPGMKYLFILLLILAIFTNFALTLLYSFILNSFIAALFSLF